MNINFTPSINIKRDITRELNYVVTPNANSIFTQLLKDYEQGVHSFSIIGSYGTGKSAFLVALAKTFLGQINYFQIPNTFKQFSSFEFLHIVGSYNSLYQKLAESFDNQLESKNTTPDIVLQQLDTYYQRDNKFLFIVIDEFGKHLEFAAKNNPDQELYFIQQLAEYVADKNIILITTLHQNFATYAINLTNKQQNEWTKVKGRLKELTFNEPVEQLLFLAAEFIHIHRKVSPQKNIKQVTNFLEDANAIPFKTKVPIETSQKLAPLEVLSTAILTLALQKYGQNERSLFTFLNSTNAYGLYEYDSIKNPYYNLSCIYDYLSHNYHSFIITKYNPHYVQWKAIWKVIELIESSVEASLLPSAIKLVKTIGLLNIFASAGAKLDDDFFEQYGKLCLGIENIKQVLTTLANKKIIRYRKYKQQYILFEGTDIDIELALLQATSQVNAIQNVAPYLQKHFNLPYKLAKAAIYKTGTPRFFEFKLSNQPISIIPKGQVDGFINLIFSGTLTEETIIQHSKLTKEAIIFGFFQQVEDVKQVIFDISKIEYVLKQEEIKADKVAYKELQNLWHYETNKLNQLVLSKLFENNNGITWIYKGEKLNITTQTQFNKQLSLICEDVYNATPIFRNELANTEKISGAISTARKNYFKALFKNWNKEDLQFSPTHFPAEKTIYLTLLKQTGIHFPENGLYFNLGKPNNITYEKLWDTCITFLQKAKVNRKPLTELASILATRPLKLKQVFIDFWLPTFLFIKQQEFALFRNDVYVPYLTADEIDIMYRRLSEYYIKAFNVSGVRLDLFNKYRELLNLQIADSPSQKSFIETIKPFLTFYHQLPKYTQQTNRLQKHTLKFREAIKTAKDPEITFFEAFPKALGYYNIEFLKDDEQALQNYVHQIQDAIRELRTAYDELLNRIESFLCKELAVKTIKFGQYKKVIQERYQVIKKHLLLPHQKTFLARLTSPLSDRNAWLNTVMTALLRKNLQQISDNDEKVLYDKLATALHELDNLCDIHEIDINPTEEEVVKIEITTISEGSKPYQMRFSKAKRQEINSLQEQIRKLLRKDKEVNQVALLELFKDLL